MLINEESREYILKNKELIDDNNFQKFFDNCDTILRSDISNFFLNDCDINFLEYMRVIPESLFYYSRIKSIDLPKSIYMIDSYGFDTCKELVSISIPDTVVDIEDHAFYSCYKLRFIKLPKYLANIKESTFAECEDLSNIILNEQLKCIGETAFYDCISLESIRIPESVEQLGENCFDNCAFLKTIELSKNTKLKNNNLEFAGLDLEKINIVYY